MLLNALLASLLLPLISAKYIEPALTLPPTPSLPLKSAKEIGYVNRTNGVDIWYARWGPSPYHASTDNTPIIFLHGELANSDYWADQVQYLLPKYPDRTIVTIDSRMQGRSTGWSQPISYYLMADDVLNVMNHLNVAKATIVGWSDGGIIGEIMAMKEPSRVDRLFDFAGQATPNQTYPNELKAKTVQEFIPRAEKEFAELSPDPSMLNTTVKKVTALEQHLSPAEFAKIPTLVEDCETAPLIWFVDAQNEELVKNGVARDLTQMVPGSGLVILPSVSHFAMMQDPETFSVVLNRFLGYEVKCSGTD